MRAARSLTKSLCRTTCVDRIMPEGMTLTLIAPSRHSAPRVRAAQAFISEDPKRCQLAYGTCGLQKDMLSNEVETVPHVSSTRCQVNE